MLFAKQRNAALKHLPAGEPTTSPMTMRLRSGFLSASRGLRFLLRFQEIHEHAFFFSKSHQTLRLGRIAQRLDGIEGGFVLGGGVAIQMIVGGGVSDQRIAETIAQKPNLKL